MGMNRVRVCIHAGTTRAEIDASVNASAAWAGGILLDNEVEPEGDRTIIEGKIKWNGSEQGQLLPIEIVVARFFFPRAINIRRMEL